MSKVEVNEIDKQSGSTLTLGGPGTAVTLASGATQSGFGRSGSVNWCTTAKTTPFTATSGSGFFVNSTSGSITVTLPASPSAGDIVAISDYAGTAGCNAIVIGRNGSKFQGACTCGAINQEREAVTLVYVDGTQGWASVADNTEAKLNKQYVAATGGCVSTVGDFKIHVFNSSSNFDVTSAGNANGSNTVDYLVVAGGGAGSDTPALNSNFLSGGGGAGGYRESSGTASGSYTRSPLGACVAALPVPVQTYPITVGAGAASGSAKGSPSIFSTITSTGGGSGGGSPNAGQPGGSGGGGFYGNDPGGTGNDPPVTPAQGTNGGQGVPATSNGGGGGGGATVAGSNANPGGGAGGAGATSEITNSPVTRAGGGGGGSGSGGTGGAGGSGGGGTGGAGQTSNPTHGAAGTVNTGGGAGGSSDYSSAGTAASSGGSGVVVIRYKFQN